MNRLVAAALICALAGFALARPPGPPSGPVPASAPEDGGVAWFGTWKAGLAEAKRTGKPILLVAAAPHCHNVSGIW